MGTMKDTNDIDLTETEDINKRWQEYTEELHKKDLNDPDNHGVITHLEPNILECKFKWVLLERSYKLYLNNYYEQSYWWCWNSCWAISNPKRWCSESAVLYMPANLENSTVATGLEKLVFIPIPKKGNAKECSNYHKITLISHAS